MNYSGLCREIASYGFLVVAINHNDGSCEYTTGKEKTITDSQTHQRITTREEILFNMKSRFGDYSLRHPQVQTREKEVQALISEIFA